MNDSPHDSSPNSSSLAEALGRFDIPAPIAFEKIDRYAQLLWEWNEKLNLTRHTDYDKFVARDLYDAMQLAGMLEQGEEVLDVGSGGGVPGVLLALLREDLEVTLCESVGKKARALESIVRELELSCPVLPERAENLLQDMRFDTLTARAVGPLSKLLVWLQPHWVSFRRLLAIKGPRWLDERNDARHRGLLHGFELRRSHSYTTPGAEIENVILEVWPKSKEVVASLRR